MNVIVCSFSGKVTELKKKDRTEEAVLSCLAKHPRVSVWDMCETPWLCQIVNRLLKDGRLKDDPKEQYPWHKFIVVKKDVDVKDE